MNGSAITGFGIFWQVPYLATDQNSSALLFPSPK
jgi:hypothetical protein